MQDAEDANLGQAGPNGTFRQKHPVPDKLCQAVWNTDGVTHRRWRDPTMRMI
jgi:hypothetical protein